MICATSYKSIADDYCQGILSGEVVACRLVRFACERHVNDLARQSTEGFPYHFSEREANAVCQFFPLALKHSKGQWASQPFELEPWQVFIFWVLFGWQRDSDNTRKFRRAHISVARKNGKSTLAAGIGLYGMMCDGEPGAEIYVSATKREQAGCIFTEAERMRESSTTLRKYTKNHINNIFCETTHSFFRPTSSDKPLDGPNPHMTIFDELHAWREIHRKFYNTMVTGGASRRQPLQVTTTTAGDDQSLIWKEEYDHCKGVLEGTFNDETIFAYMAEIDDEDDPLDPAVWIKANPNLGVSVSMEYLQQQANDAKNKPSFLPVFISKHCNKITSSRNKAFDRDLWAKCSTPLSDWTKADAFGAGFDLGGRDDLASSAIVARFLVDGSDPAKPVYRYEAKVRTYCYTDTKRDLATEPFQSWVHDGRLRVERHVIAALRDDLFADLDAYGIQRVGYDPSNAQQLGDEIEARGNKAVRITQSYFQYNEPIKELHECIRTERFSFGGCPVINWAANNAIIVKNHADQWMFDKVSSADKIDPIVAVTMAFRMATLAPARITGSIYIK